MNDIAVQKISHIPIDYRPDLASCLFSAIEALPWSMLLRSASPSHPDNRFDVLVARPLATLVTVGEQTRIFHDGETHSTNQDPFAVLNEWQQRLLPEQEQIGELPFIGGALGYFSYDLGRRVETLPELAERDIDAPDMAVGLYEWALVVDHKERTACIAGVNAKEHYEWLISQNAAGREAFSLTGEWQSNMDKAGYTRRFNQVQEYLKSGDCYQINLAQRFSAGYQGSEWQAYEKLEKANGAPFSAFIRTENNVILSVSPERFLELRGRDIETKPIKGTRPRDLSNPERDTALALELTTTEKDQAENLMIVDLLRNDIGRVATPGSVHVPHLFEVESFPAVHHLVSTIRAKLDSQYTATDLLRACFPGGSITGAPKVRAMEIIEELEPHRRSAYCGSIGYISRCGQMDSSITIRTLITDNQRICAWAGGGLVADSEAGAEYQETLDKLSRILPVLNP